MKAKEKISLMNYLLAFGISIILISIKIVVTCDCSKINSTALSPKVSYIVTIVIESLIAPKYDKSPSFLFLEYIPKNLKGDSFSKFISGHKFKTFNPLEKLSINSFASS